MQHMTPLPSFDFFHYMLDLEEHTNNKDPLLSQDSALVTDQRAFFPPPQENSYSRAAANNLDGRHYQPS